MKDWDKLSAKKKLIEEVSALIYQNACCSFDVEEAVGKLYNDGYLKLPEESKMMQFELGLSNLYGSVSVHSRDGKFFMELDCCIGNDVLGIPEYLYEALLKFHNENNLK